jgi:hypothetical protein
MSGQNNKEEQANKTVRNITFASTGVGAVLVGLATYGLFIKNSEEEASPDETTEIVETPAELKDAVQTILDTYQKGLAAEQSKLLAEFTQASPDGEGRISNKGDIYIIQKDPATAGLSYGWSDGFAGLAAIIERDDADVVSAEILKGTDPIPAYDSKEFKDLVIGEAYDLRILGFPDVDNRSDITATYNVSTGRVCDMTMVQIANLKEADCFSKFEAAAGTKLAKQIEQIDKYDFEQQNLPQGGCTKQECSSPNPNGP